MWAGSSHRAFWGLSPTTTIRGFDHEVTAPINGFDSAEDYYAKCNSKQFLGTIETPALLLNTLDDPFLSETCYPKDLKSKFVTYEEQNHGGHVGFYSPGQGKQLWSEKRVVDFLKA